MTTHFTPDVQAVLDDTMSIMHEVGEPVLLVLFEEQMEVTIDGMLGHASAYDKGTRGIAAGMFYEELAASGFDRDQLAMIVAQLTIGWKRERDAQSQRIN